MRAAPIAWLTKSTRTAASRRNATPATAPPSRKVYNHIIMPLASERDALTQIRWGIADFEHRFGRKPEGMWLAETAVSRNVLDLMAAEGIKFTILAPHQCARVRKLATGNSQPENWTETRNASADTAHPYFVRLEEGSSIAVFFYDGPTSRSIAFEGLLNSGEAFAERLFRSPLRTTVAADSRRFKARRTTHRASRTLLLTAKATAITTSMARWRSLMPCT